MQLLGSNIWEGIEGLVRAQNQTPTHWGLGESRPRLDSLPKIQKQKPQTLPSPRVRSLGPQQLAPSEPISPHFLIPSNQGPQHPLL